MKEHSLEEANKIIKKVTNSPLMAKFALLVSLFFLGMSIFGIITISHDRAAIIFIILGGILFITFLSIYLFQSSRVKKNTKNVDMEKVRKELMEGAICHNIRKTYFTKNYMLANFYYGFIVEYKDILWIYKRTLIQPNTMLPTFDLVVCHKNGKKYYTDYDDSFIDIIVEHNKNVLVGNDSDQKNKYKELLKEINK